MLIIKHFTQLVNVMLVANKFAVTTTLLHVFLTSAIHSCAHPISHSTRNC